jgi:hypothetical protein
MPDQIRPSGQPVRTILRPILGEMLRPMLNRATASHPEPPCSVPKGFNEAILPLEHVVGPSSGLMPPFVSAKPEPSPE